MIFFSRNLQFYIPSFDKEKSSGKYSSLSRNNIIEVASSFNWLETSPMALGTSTFGLHMIVLLSFPKKGWKWVYFGGHRKKTPPNFWAEWTASTSQLLSPK